MGDVSRRARVALALVPTLAGLILGGVGQARAQTPPVSVQQTPPTTLGLLDQLLQGLLGPPPTAPPPQPAPTAPPPAPAVPAGQDGSGGAGATPTTSVDRTVPPEAQAIIDSVRRTGSNNSLALLDALRPLADQGLSAEEAALIGMGQFPVAGEAYWSDDWLEARFTPAFHLHQGNDLFAARGTPVRAPAEGSVSFASEGAGGLAAYVTVPDGTYYYMAHLDSFARDVRSGASVKQGTVVGFVGSSGNADGGAPHLHFEIHPRGGAATNPKLILDKWIADAIAHVRDILGAYEIGLPRPLTAAGMLRRLDSGSLGGPSTSDGPELWRASVRRENGAVRLAAGAGAGAVAEGLGLEDPVVVRSPAGSLGWLRAQQMARDVLAPLTPKVLDGLSPGPGRG
jgi:hypothetical protein